jgi:hypothetical protein
MASISVNRGSLPFLEHSDVVDNDMRDSCV